MKLLVTGGAGYIGSHTTKALLDGGHQVVVLDNLSTGFREAIPESAKFVTGDIRDLAAVSQLMQKEKIEGVVHFAAKLIVPESVAQPLEYYDNNVFGTNQLLRACQANQVRNFVFSSTAAVYGEGQGRPLLEADPVAPINPYGRTKLVSEGLLRDLQVSWPDFRFVILRYFNVAGAAMTWSNGQRSLNATHLIKVACEVLAKKRQVIEIFGNDYATPDGTCIRDYIHVDDLASAHVCALESLQKGNPGGIFNCGYGHGASVKQVIDVLGQVAGYPVPSKQSGRRAGDPAILVSNPSRLQKELGWSPRHDSLQIICQSALKWELSSQNNSEKRN